jgi:hypothetical protein
LERYRVGPAELETLNNALSTLFAQLRDAKALFENAGNGGRAGTVVALSAVWTFVAQFGAAREGLHIPLLDLAGALIALNTNNVLPVLMPHPRSGRAYDSPKRQALVGFAAGAVEQLRWTGMCPAEAHRVVAAELSKWGVKPARGTRPIKARTVRDWCERVRAGLPLFRSLTTPSSQAGQEWYEKDRPAELGLITAAGNAASLLTEEQRKRIQVLPTNMSRRYILDALSNSIRAMKLGDAN